MSTTCNSPRSDKKFGVAAADGHVVEQDVAARIAACGCDRLMQRESETGVGAALYDEHGGGGPFDFRHCALGDDFSRRLVIVGLGHVLFLFHCSGGAA